ncbi:hypothetical protein ACFQMM_18160 [Saliphagus sp. GCM10025308]
MWKNSALDLDLDDRIVVRDDLVYAIDRSRNGDGSLAEELVAVDATSGSEAWRFSPPNVSTSSAEYDEWYLFEPVVTDDAVFVRQRETSRRTVTSG